MAYDFNGTSQYLSTTSTPISAAPCTLACWFTLNDTASGTVLISLQDTDGQSRIQISNNGLTSPKRAIQLVAFSSAGTTHALGINTSAHTTNTWYHGAGVFVSPANCLPYFNGGAGVTESNQGGAAPSGIDQILIGARYATSLGAYANGSLAEVGIWNAALTADEVASLAKGMTCDKIRPQNLVFYAPLIRDLQDVRGGLTITNNNAATVATHPRVYA